MRQDYSEFTRRGAEIISVGPEGAEDFRRYWERERIPFVGLADPQHVVANLYEQEVSLLKLGRMPALILVDAEGRVGYSHHASWMSDIPANADVLAVLDGLLANSPQRGKLD